MFTPITFPNLIYECAPACSSALKPCLSAFLIVFRAALPPHRFHHHLSHQSVNHLPGPQRRHPQQKTRCTDAYEEIMPLQRRHMQQADVAAFGSELIGPDVGDGTLVFVFTMVYLLLRAFLSLLLQSLL